MLTEMKEPYMPDKERWDFERRNMVEDLRLYGIRDKRVLAAMERIPRHLFIPPDFRQPDSAYGDHPCPIGNGQTISQPYIVAYMTEKLKLKPGSRVLEIGTGSGYQSAVLAELGACVYSIECVASLADHARSVLTELGYADRIHFRCGDGHQGWPGEAPFDAIIVTCGPESAPPELMAQLGPGGRMIVPVGPKGNQRLILLHHTRSGIRQTNDLAVLFVPMVLSKTP
jgi:protein-L-isoaspartate(D-aspartate) O-methyltransferase